MSKVTYHIPTEQYGFVEIEKEVSEKGLAIDIDSYESVKASITPQNGTGEGLDDKEWRMTLDGYLTVGTCPSDAYERMNSMQQNVMQEIKKAFKRINPPDKRD